MDYVEEALALYQSGKKDRGQLEAVLFSIAFSLTVAASAAHKVRIEDAVRQALRGLDDNTPIQNVAAAVRDVMRRVTDKTL